MTSPKIKWDGSDIGVLDSKFIIERHKIDSTNEELWTIAVDDKKSIEVQARPVRDKFQCLIDEMKPLFGLFKQGTHFVICDKKKYMLSKPMVSRIIIGGKIVYRVSGNLRDTTIDKSNKVFKDQVRSIYAFRYLFCISQSTDRLIRVRYYKYGNPEPLSTSEVTTSIDIKKVKVIPQTVMKRWFGEQGEAEGSVFIDTLSRLIRLTNEPEIKDIEILSRYSSAMEDVVNRVDKSYTSYISMVIKRLSDVISHINSFRNKCKIKNPQT
jgi:hypothetical protein